MDNRKWKYIDDFSTKLQIFDDGTIMIVNTGKNLTTTTNKSGWIGVKININNKTKVFYVDDLMAKYFLEQPTETQLLVHTDGNLQNNNLANLKYSDYNEIESKHYATKIKPIFQFDLDYNYMKKWNLIGDIVKSNTDYNEGPIYHNLADIAKSAYNYIWTYDRGLIKAIITVVSIIDENNFLDRDTYNYPDPTKEYYKDIMKFEEGYKISSKGNVYSKAQNKLFTLTPIDTGIKVKLYDSNKIPQYFMVHQLVADHFIQKPNDFNEKRYVVDHIDKNKNNNTITNLRWITASESSKAHHLNKPENAILQYSMTNVLIKKWDNIDDILVANNTYSRNALLANLNATTNSSYDYIWKYETPLIKKIKDQTIKEDEEFVNVGTLDDKDFSLYAISNHGNVKNEQTKLILSPAVSTSGYHTVALTYYETEGDKKVPLQSMQKIHRLVALKFCPNTDNTKNIVNHIDKNKLNNHHKNLEWTTRSENTVGKKVNQVDIKTGKVIKTYESIALASQAHNTTSTANIRGVLNGRKKTAYGYMWTFA